MRDMKKKFVFGLVLVLLYLQSMSQFVTIQGRQFKDENGNPSIREPDAWTSCRWAPDDESLPLIYRKSYVTDWHPICYTTEALKFSQTAYLIIIVCVQWADLMICKTRNLSLG